MIAGKRVAAIAGMDEGRVIGFQGRLPWHIPEDLKMFSKLTRGHTVVMGRKTYDSLPEKFKPLPGRKNIILSRSISSVQDAPEVSVYGSVEEFTGAVNRDPSEFPGGTIWIIGGEEIYRQTLKLCDEVFLTEVKGRHQGDAFFPEFESDFTEIAREDFDGFSFVTYRRNNS